MPVISGQAAKPPVIGPITPVRWRPCTVPAALGTVALIALQDKDDGCWFMAERMYVAKDDGWRCELSDLPLDFADGYCWLPEHELLAGLRAPT
jgi:hypothetical protein